MSIMRRAVFLHCVSGKNCQRQVLQAERQKYAL